ncbi:MAG: hypothetical protein RBR77_08910 [Thauera sp.]|jgi:hypothetical protein|nr:hypothetical protein [Thauera sp.]
MIASKAGLGGEVTVSSALLPDICATRGQGLPGDDLAFIAAALDNVAHLTGSWLASLRTVRLP